MKPGLFNRCKSAGLPLDRRHIAQATLNSLLPSKRRGINTNFRDKLLHMKTKVFFAVTLFLGLFFGAWAQEKTSGTAQVKTASSLADSSELIAFQRLVQFISVEDPSIKAREGLSDSLSHFGEEHQLVVPVLTYPGSSESMAARFSYDNFLPTVYNKEALHGSPFLLSNYVPGLVVNEHYTVIDKPDYLYNYDKMSGNCLLQRGKDKPIAVNKNQVLYYCLKLKTGGYIFERVALINPDEFFQVLHKGPKYSCYKLYKSKFVPAHQSTNGYVTEGNNYDEYQDIITYYLVDQKKEEALIFEMTKKSIRKILASESAAVEQYFKDHKYEEVDESFTVHLLEALNK
jgi:hypothetical protein